MNLQTTKARGKSRSIYLPDDLLVAAENRAKSNRRSFSSHVAWLVDQDLKNESTQHDQKRTRSRN